jgi:putative DNA modification/repair radical SAM protein
MDIRTKLSILADAAKYDASCASTGAGTRRARPASPAAAAVEAAEAMGICQSYAPDGRRVSLLKILLTNHCIYDCSYCINRRSSDVPRAQFRVEEVVALVLDLYRRNHVEGLFLSSGVIRSPDHTMEQLVAVARSLRRDHHFFGYIHLKTIPDASPELIAEAGRWADRLSVNVELPRQRDLDRLAPEKDLVQITRSMGTIRSHIDEAREERARTERAPRFAPAGQTTQMIVGATDASDAAILTTAAGLYAAQGLRRVYYSAFSPIPDASPLLPPAPPPLLREHRLYQADWLMRHYGFAPDELTTRREPNLDLSLDPKLAWALRNRDRFPVDVNRASAAELLRVPGLGARNVERIVAIRRWHKLRLADLVRLRVQVKRALPFLVAADHTPHLLRGADAVDLRDRIAPARQQLDLFAVQRAAAAGEL